LEISDRAQAPADQALNLLSTPRDAASGRFAIDPLIRRAGQPRPLPVKKRGTVSSTQAVQSTRVRPNSHKTEASGFSVKSI
jgi:hypothetical protein